MLARRSVVVVVALSLAGLLVGPAVMAQPAAHDAPPTVEQRRTQQARELFTKGSALAGEDRWGEALAAFEQSAALRAHASTTYNIGYCERGLGHYTRARMLFARALEQSRVSGGSELTDDQRTAATQYLREASQKLVRLTVTVEPAGARLQVDGRPLELESGETGKQVWVAGTREVGPGEAAPDAPFTVLLDPGTRSFVVAAAGIQTRRQLRFEPGEARQLQLLVDKEPVDDGDAATRGTRLGWALGMTGLSLTAITVGSVLGGLAIASWDDAQQQCPQLVSCPNDNGFESSNDARQLGDFATVSFGVAGAALASAVLLWLTAPDAGPEEAGGDAPVAVAPALGPTSVGLGLTLGF